MKYKFEEKTSHLNLLNKSAKYFAMKKVTSEFLILVLQINQNKLQNKNEHTQHKKIAIAFL